MWFIGAEVEQETSAPPPKKNPRSAPGSFNLVDTKRVFFYFKGAVSRNSAKLGNYKMPVKLRET